MQIDKLKDLKQFLDSLTDAQLDQKFTITLDNYFYFSPEVDMTPEPIYINTGNEQEFGTIAELKELYSEADGEIFDINDYYESDRLGNIYFSIDS